MSTHEEIDIEMKFEVEEYDLEYPLQVKPNEASLLEDQVEPNDNYEQTQRNLEVVPCPNEDNLILEDWLEANDNDQLTSRSDFIESANDISAKINIALNVLQACKDEAELGQQITGTLIYHKLEYYTKVPQNDPLMIEVLNEKYEDRSLKQALVETKPLPLSVLPFIYNDVRDIFIEYYVKKKQIPTVTDFMTSLQNIQKDSFYKNATIRTLVKNKLVDYHHFPTLQRFIINENPKLAYERHLYLRQIIGYRTRGKSIVYVTVLKILADKYLVLAVSSTAGLIAKSDCLCDTNDGDELGSNQVRSWIQSELLPVLSPKVVVVLMQPLKNVTTPTPSSSKQTIIKWLQDRGIPCDVESHKFHLYNLFKICHKNYKEQGFYENIFASNGFKVVVCRIEYPRLIFLHDICSNISNTIGNVSFNIIKMLKDLSHEEWVMMEKKVIKEEKQMMKDDEEMVTIIDNLLEMVKNGDIKAEEFPDGCFGTKVDNFHVHIGDVLID